MSGCGGNPLTSHDACVTFPGVRPVPHRHHRRRGRWCRALLEAAKAGGSLILEINDSGSPSARSMRTSYGALLERFRRFDIAQLTLIHQVTAAKRKLEEAPGKHDVFPETLPRLLNREKHFNSAPRANGSLKKRERKGQGLPRRQLASAILSDSRSLQSDGESPTTRAKLRLNWEREPKPTS